MSLPWSGYASESLAQGNFHYLEIFSLDTASGSELWGSSNESGTSTPEERAAIAGYFAQPGPFPFGALYFRNSKFMVTGRAPEGSLYAKHGSETEKVGFVAVQTKSAVVAATYNAADVPCGGGPHVAFAESLANSLKATEY